LLVSINHELFPASLQSNEKRRRRSQAFSALSLIGSLRCGGADLGNFLPAKRLKVDEPIVGSIPVPSTSKQEAKSEGGSGVGVVLK